MTSHEVPPDLAHYAESFQLFRKLASFLDTEAMTFEHRVLEEQLFEKGRDVFRQMFQDHLVVRAEREERTEVVDASGVARPSVEAGHHRTLATIFGQVDVERLAYRKRGEENLHPADAVLNLPEEKHSHGLRRISAVEATRGSYDEATQAIERATGQKVGKRQVESLVKQASGDVEEFYQQRCAPDCDPDDALVLSVDGHGIVMGPEALRQATRKAAETSTPKLETRVSKGEKRGRKRMAEIGTVYDITPVLRSVADVMAGKEAQVQAPVAKNKWLTASVVDDAAEVIKDVFDEAERRDGEHQRYWVALVDGNIHQIDRIEKEAAKRTIEITVIIDLIHVLEYIWTAAWCFFEGDSDAEAWAYERTMAVLGGGATDVAAGIRRRASSEHLKATARKGADECARYLVNKAAYLDYPKALARGWQVAAGIIEGACRHIVKDRVDSTGARWGLEGTEAVLKVRVVRRNGDFDKYWRFHLSKEHERVHLSRYVDGAIPMAA